MARLSDHEIELVRELRESGLSYGLIAKKLEAGKSTIFDICKGKYR